MPNTTGPAASGAVPAIGSPLRPPVAGGAASSSVSAVSRRSVLTGALAAPLAATAVPVTPEELHPDADLIELGRRLRAAWAAEKAVHAKWGDINSADADREINTAFDSVLTIVDQIESIQAATMRGIEVKMRALLWCRGGDPFEDEWPRTTDVRLAFGICNDLQAMGAADV